MTALTEVIRRHEAAVAAGSLPSTTYRAGVLTAQEWRGHGRKNPGSRLWRQARRLVEVAAIYGTAGCINDRRQDVAS